jgi:hypothetical protein
MRGTSGPVATSVGGSSLLIETSSEGQSRAALVVHHLSEDLDSPYEVKEGFLYELLAFVPVCS